MYLSVEVNIACWSWNINLCHQVVGLKNVPNITAIEQQTHDTLFMKILSKSYCIKFYSAQFKIEQVKFAWQLFENFWCKNVAHNTDDHMNYEGESTSYQYEFFHNRIVLPFVAIYYEIEDESQT